MHEWRWENVERQKAGKTKSCWKTNEESVAREVYCCAVKQCWWVQGTQELRWSHTGRISKPQQQIRFSLHLKADYWSQGPRQQRQNAENGVSRKPCARFPLYESLSIQPRSPPFRLPLPTMNVRCKAAHECWILMQWALSPAGRCSESSEKRKRKKKMKRSEKDIEALVM